MFDQPYKSAHQITSLKWPIIFPLSPSLSSNIGF
jgi:hypothetical protein